MIQLQKTTTIFFYNPVKSTIAALYNNFLNYPNLGEGPFAANSLNGIIYAVDYESEAVHGIVTFVIESGKVSFQNTNTKSKFNTMVAVNLNLLVGVIDGTNAELATIVHISPNSGMVRTTASLHAKLVTNLAYNSNNHYVYCVGIDFGTYFLIAYDVMSEKMVSRIAIHSMDVNDFHTGFVINP